MSNKDMPAYPGKMRKLHRDPESGSTAIIDDGFGGGLTKLESFTMAALQGICAGKQLSNLDSIKDVAHHAVRVAEAALAELETRP